MKVERAWYESPVFVFALALACAIAVYAFYAVRKDSDVVAVNRDARKTEAPDVGNKAAPGKVVEKAEQQNAEETLAADSKQNPQDPGLNLRLLATTVVTTQDDDPDKAARLSRATIEDINRERRHTMRIGDRLRGYDDIKLVGIHTDSVVFDNKGEPYLVYLDPEDVLNPRLDVWPAEVDPFNLEELQRGESDGHWDDGNMGVEDLYGRARYFAGIRTLRDEFALAHQGNFAPYLAGGKQLGLFVSESLPGSFYAQLSLQKYDIVYSVNGRTLTTPEDNAAVLEMFKNGQELTLEVERDGEIIEIQTRTVKPFADPEEPESGGG